MDRTRMEILDQLSKTSCIPKIHQPQGARNPKTPVTMVIRLHGVFLSLP